MAQVAQAPAYGGLRQSSFDRPRTSSQDEEEVVSVRCDVFTLQWTTCQTLDQAPVLSSKAQSHRLTKRDRRKFAGHPRTKMRNPLGALWLLIRMLHVGPYPVAMTRGIEKCASPAQMPQGLAAT